MAENKMGTMPVTKLILSMSLPAIFSMLIQSLYNIVDSIFVSALGEDALTAVSLAYPMQMLIVAFAVGTGVGVNSLIARRLGEKRQEEANHAAVHGIVLSIITWVIFALIGIFFTKPFILGMASGNNDVSQNIINWGIDYMSVVMIFSFGAFICVSFEKSIQATGNMFYPMIFQLLGAIINIILDPIFIFGYFGVPAFGVKGAAIATVLGQILSMVYAVYVVCKKDFAVKFNLKGFKFRLKTVKDIYAVGIPSIVMQSIASVLITFLNKILILLTPTAVTVLGVYFKLQSFVFMPVFGLTQGVMPIMGYNFGAKNKARLKETVKKGVIFAFSIMAAGTLLFMIIPKQLLMIFNASKDMLKIGIPALRTISINFMPAAIGIMFGTFFQAIGKGVYSLIISFLRQIIILLPAAKILSYLGVTYVWYAFPIAESVALVVSIFMYISVYNKKIRTLGN
ncbi:MAG: MATE family efflux transporter [Ruminococcaceae bacterium]|nr:MATE family efflux transporter [Oscillospiraceae bacterium]